jgi:pimeloyl-ACP methyl ester carboxylesterase
MNQGNYLTQYQEINGSKIAYIHAGIKKRKTILFIHGLGENMQTWTKNINGLKDRFHCIAIDLPGHGLSTQEDSDYSPYFFAETIQQFLKEIGIQEVTIVGHSLGGQVAIILSISYSALVNNLVLIAPAGFETFSKEEKQWIINHSKSYLNPVREFSFFALVPGLKNNYPSNEIYTKVVKGMLDQPVFEHLHQLTQQVLIIFGKEDPFIPNLFLHPHSSPTIIAETGTEQIKSAQLKMIANAGHFVHIEQASVVNSLIEDFASSGS